MYNLLTEILNVFFFSIINRVHFYRFCALLQPENWLFKYPRISRTWQRNCLLPVSMVEAPTTLNVSSIPTIDLVKKIGFIAKCLLFTSDCGSDLSEPSQQLKVPKSAHVPEPHSTHNRRDNATLADVACFLKLDQSLIKITCILHNRTGYNTIV